MGRPLADLFLTVAAARALHDVDGLQAVVAAVGVGGVVGQRDSIEGIDPMEGLIFAITALAARLVCSFGQATPPLKDL